MYKYNPNVEESESDTDTESTAGSETGSEFPNIAYKPTQNTITHADALQQWASFAKSSTDVIETFQDTINNSDDPVPKDTIIGLSNTTLKFEERKQTHIIMVDSLDRDQHSYPLPTQFRLKLPRIYKNVERIDILNVKFFCGIYAISASRKNNTLWLSDINGQRPIVIPDGTYTLPILMSTLSAELNTGTVKYTATFNAITGRIQIKGSSIFSLLFYSKALPLYNQTAYSEWGLGWVLGWGGQPVDQTGKTSYTANNFPRIIDDYIYLQLNDTERMNSIDHTDVENSSTSQESTGQVAHYFGKLLLNTFGCYAQTFVEAPKHFAPVLGRLDRLNFTWTDRRGNPLLGPDAASCDWHMALRVTEIVEAPTASSTLMQSMNRNQQSVNRN